MDQDAPGAPAVTLALCGDVMTGRGVDQILPYPSDPIIYEPALRTATAYVTLAERADGPIPRPVDYAYPWGDALAMLDEAAPDLRLINLETAVTTNPTPWPGKPIQYRMHPANTPCLSAARIDCCVLANNHVLDWGYAGLRDTLFHVQHVGMKTAGAGVDRDAAGAPAILSLPGRGRVLIFAWALSSSGVPHTWAAGHRRPGVNWLPDCEPARFERVTAQIRAARQPGDLVVVSLHWGDNWGYPIPASHRAFAHELVTTGGVDLVYGHSAHHPLGIEVYRGRLILYGCGDLINDYEGIGGYADYRPDLGVIVLAGLSPADGRMVRARLLPVRRRRLRLWRATVEEAGWLARRLDRESRELGARVALQPDGTLEVGCSV